MVAGELLRRKEMSKRKIAWKDGKGSAAIISVELDAELIWLMLDPTNIKRPKVLSMGTYGIHRGLGRMLESLEKRNLKATFFVPGAMAERYPEKIREAAAAGHEIALHGYQHENFGLLEPEQQIEAVEKGIAAIVKAVGRKPSGFRLPEGNMTPETLRILNDAGFLYDSSMADDDIPYQTAIDGWPVRMIEIPMHWEMQDFPYFAFNFFPPFPNGECRISNYGDVLDIWLSELKAFHEFGLCYVIKFDPQTIGTPARIAMFDKVLDEMLAKDIWIATGEEVASYYSREYVKLVYLE